MGEASALDESFADIFGQEFERINRDGGNTTNWTIGEDCQHIVRYMDHPSLSDYSYVSGHNGPGQPSVYKGDRWFYGFDQGGFSHINNGVQNYWFALLCSGSAGKPDGTYNNIVVNAISSNAARNIAFYNFDNFLTTSSKYIDSRNGSLLAAMSMFGLCSNEYKQTLNAWAAVGIGEPYKPVTITGPMFVFLNTNGQYTGSYPINFTADGGFRNGHPNYYSWTVSSPWTYNTVIDFPIRTQTLKVTNLNNAYITTTIEAKDKCNAVSQKTIHFLIPHLLHLFPNPVTSNGQFELEVDFYDANNGVATAYIYDAQNNLKVQQPINSKSTNFKLPNLQPGNYFIQVVQGDIQESIQLIKE